VNLIDGSPAPPPATATPGTDPAPAALPRLGGRILRGTAVVMTGSVAETGLGFLKNVLAAYYFGTTGSMDAYLVALLLPDLVMYLALTGSFTFIPLFAEARAQSEAESWRVASKMITYWLLLLVGGLGIAALGTPELMHLLAPGFDPAQRERTVAMSRCLLLMSGGIAVARVMSLPLLAQGKFAAAKAAEVAFQVASILYLVGFQSRGISALVWGMVLGAFIQLLVIAGTLWRRRQLLHLDLDLGAPAVRRMVKLILPVYVSTSATQFNSVVNRAFASLLPAGAISGLQYAMTLTEGPVSIVAASLASAAFPFLSRQYAEKRDAQAEGSAGRAILAMLVLFLPLSVGAFLLARPIVELLLQRGSFDRHSTELTSAALRVYAVGIAAMAVNRFLPTAFQARQNTTIPMQAGLVRIATSAGLCFVLVPRFAHLGVAAAAVAGEYLKLALLLVRLPRGIFRGQGWSRLGLLPRLVAATGSMAVVVLAARHSLLDAGRLTGLAVALPLAGIVALGAVSYAAALCLLFRKESIEWLRRLTPRRVAAATHETP